MAYVNNYEDDHNIHQQDFLKPAWIVRLPKK